MNPLTYLVDALRGMMVANGQSLHSMPVDFAVIAGSFVILAAIAAKLFPTLVN
jgi:ABC-2 type transport system permease protein